MPVFANFCAGAVNLEFQHKGVEYVAYCDASFSARTVTISTRINTLVGLPITGVYLVGIGAVASGCGFNPKLIYFSEVFGPNNMTLDMTNAPQGEYFWHINISGQDVFCPAFYWGGSNIGFLSSSSEAGQGIKSYYLLTSLTICIWLLLGVNFYRIFRARY